MPTPTLERADFISGAREVATESHRKSDTLYNITLAYLLMKGQSEGRMTPLISQIKEKHFIDAHTIRIFALQKYSALEARLLFDRETNTNEMVQILLDKLNGIGEQYNTIQEAIERNTDYNTLYMFLNKIHYVGTPTPPESRYQRRLTFKLSEDVQAILSPAEIKQYKQHLKHLRTFNKQLAPTQEKQINPNIDEEAGKLSLTALDTTIRQALTGDKNPNNITNLDDMTAHFTAAFRQKYHDLGDEVLYVEKNYAAQLSAAIKAFVKHQTTFSTTSGISSPISNTILAETDKIFAIADKEQELPPQPPSPVESFRRGFTSFVRKLSGDEQLPQNQVTTI